MIKNNCPTPQTSPNYITMVTSPQQAKQPMQEVRGILPVRRKMPHGWPKCLKRTPPKIALRKNDLYKIQKVENHHYEALQEPQEKDKNKVFFKMQINEQSNIHEDAFNENYELVEERETTI